MDKEHKKLIIMLDKFIEEFNKDPIKSGLLLEEFKLFLIRHFSIEELAIFTILNDMNSQNINTSFELIKEHQEMMALLVKIQNELGKQVEKDVIELEKDLKAHRIFEDDEFYPKLEEELNENQKLEIIRKIKERIHFL